MRIFAIADASRRKAEPIGILVWQPSATNRQGRFFLQLTQTCAERRLPLSLSFCTQREGRCSTPSEGEDWVRSRIVPESRHNIAEVLRANGLCDYDMVALFAACKGRSSDDDLLAYELDVPEGFAAAMPPTEEDVTPAPTLPPLFADEVLAHVQRARCAGEVRYAFVSLGDKRDDSARNKRTSKAACTPSPPNAAERIGKQIRAARQEAGLTQTQLAARAGITQTVLSRIESGKGNPTLGLLEDVAAALDAKLEMLLR